MNYKKNLQYFISIMSVFIQLIRQSKVRNTQQRKGQLMLDMQRVKIGLTHGEPVNALNQKLLGSLTQVLSHFSHIQLCVILQTVAYQAPLSMGFSRQGCWSRLTCPLPGDPKSGIKPVSFMSPELEAGSLPLAPPGKTQEHIRKAA